MSTAASEISATQADTKSHPVAAGEVHHLPGEDAIVRLKGEAPTATEARRIHDVMMRFGYCVVPNVLTTDEADAARNRLMALLEAERDEGGRYAAGQQRCVEIAVKDEVFRDLMAHPVTLAVWRSILGEDMVCSSWTGNTLYPGFGTVGWHVDFPFWSMQPPYPVAEILCGQTIWLLDDTTMANGATAMGEGTHLLGYPPTDAKASPSRVVRMCGQRGSVVFAHGAWWHTAMPNQSDQPRSVLLGMYARKILLTQEDLRAQLAKIESPTEDVRVLMGDDQYTPVDGSLAGKARKK